MRKTNGWAGILCCLLLLACNGGKQAGVPAKEDKEALVFALPEVPDGLQSPEERLDFVVRHYWDRFDFEDTAYVRAPDVAEQALVDYIDLLGRVSAELSDSCLTRTLRQASREESLLHYFAETFRTYLFESGSPLRNVRLYEPVARFLAASLPAGEAVRSRARHDLKLIGMNRVGSVAADFTYTLPSGRQARMHAMRSPYTLLLFYSPECRECTATLAAMKASAVLNHPQVRTRVKVLAFYPDADRDAWMRHRGEMPDGWIDCYDKEGDVWGKERYDLQAMPVLYLLDRDKKVLLKEVSVEEVEDYFKNKWF